MRPAVIITPAAELDIADAIGWYESVGPGLSSAFRLALDAALGHIAEYPDSYAVIARGTRRALLSRFPHGVFYRHDGDAVHVVAVLHPGREPRAWQARSH